VPHSPSISFILILSPELYLVWEVRSTDREAPRCCSLLHFPHRPKYPRFHPSLEPSQPMFRSWCDRPSLTPCQTAGNVTILYSLIFIFFDSKLRQKFLLRMTARISCLHCSRNFFMNWILIC
jgi:hypothetical protein